MTSFSLAHLRSIRVPSPFPVGPVNVHLIRRDPVTLVDAGPLTNTAWEHLVKGLAREGLSPSEVRRVVVTHGHHDHFGLAARLAGCGAEIAAGRLAERALRMQLGSPALLDDMARSGFGLLERFRLVVSRVAIDRVAEPLADFRPLGGGEVLDGDGWSLRVLATPGHTPGSLAFVLPKAGVVFTGDTVLDRITPNAVVSEHPENRGEIYVGLSQYLATLQALRKTARGAVLLTGHGAPIPDLELRLPDVRRRNEARERAIEQHLGSRAMTVRELVHALFPRLDIVNLFLGYSEVRGFLSLLEEQGRVTKHAGRLLDRWRLAA
jgi:glyoxylase-like metal-dependent hydrolase (beta-lactamase superfamily II)